MKLIIPGAINAQTTLPSALQNQHERSSSLSSSSTSTPIKWQASYELQAPHRDGSHPSETLDIQENHILALETTNGTTVFISAKKLKQDLQNKYPNLATEQLDLNLLKNPTNKQRNVAAEWLWSKLSIFELIPDQLTETAKQKASAWLTEKLQMETQEMADAGASWLGTKALMWAIESRLAGTPGLYRWKNEHIDVTDHVLPDDKMLHEDAKQGSILLFIHGTASSTLGSFKDFKQGMSQNEVDKIKQQFGTRIYGYEHRTFSDSPIDNALEIANALPANSELCLVTHSRGGLVGDLLCLNPLDENDIKRYIRKAPAKRNNEATESPDQRRIREWVNKDEQQKLQQLSDLLTQKQFNIHRYVRVACPSAGTRLLSDNLDLFLSNSLSLMNTLIGNISGPLGTSLLDSFRRIVLEIADKRIQPQFVPGIEAMMPDSPLTSFLAQAKRQANIKMSVIAGDIEGEHIVKKLALIFTDWMFFDEQHNDLVVDTQSMFAGLAYRNPTHALFDQGNNVDHFCYFKNPQTRTAIVHWLTKEDPSHISSFSPLSPKSIINTNMADQRSQIPNNSQLETNDKPILILLPGIMGSHLEVRDDDESTTQGHRVWLDIPNLMIRGLSDMRVRSGRHILPEGLIDAFYGDLFLHLQQTFFTIPFAYDWRKPIQTESSEKLINLLDKLMMQSQQPIHLLAHSMGGLIVRTAFSPPKRPDLWEAIVKRGGNFTMLGTPNHGSHAMVENLFCKGDITRKLARLDLTHSPQTLLTIMADFVGALQLLPAPEFEDEHQRGFDYFDADAWVKHKALNKDRWFDDHLLGEPSPTDLNKAIELWTTYLQTDLPHNDRINYVFGKAKSTPSGLHIENNQLSFCSTNRGDGSVSWKSGKAHWINEDRYWYMPEEHAKMTTKSEHFAAISDLVSQNTTKRLPKEAPFIAERSHHSHEMREVGPPTLANEYHLLTLSSLPPLPPLNMDQELHVCVKAMDLRYVQHPLMCGHYAGDAINGTEALVDHYLVDGALTQRERMGIFADEIGTNTVIISPENAEERQRGTNRGAIVVGLGEWGQLSNQKLQESVRDAVLAYLLHVQESHHQHTHANAPQCLQLNSLLLGYSANSHIIIESSVDSIVRGVCAANHKFRTTCNHISNADVLHIGKLNFIEYYLDIAITAAHAVASLPQRLANDLKDKHVRLIADKTLHRHGDTQIRLSVSQSSSNWPQMSITNADNGTRYAHPNNPVPAKLPANIHTLLTQPPVDSDQAVMNSEAAEYLEYLFVSQRARAEATVQQRQPGLIEALVSKIIHRSEYDADICRTLFELMVPLDFKAAARQTERLMLVLDSYTANLPWEMLQADNEPLALKTAMIRKLASSRYRRIVNNAGKNTACIIGNPSTDGFYDHFPRPIGLNDNTNHLASLKGAAQEAQTVHQLLQQAHYEVNHLYPSADDEHPPHRALAVFNTLFQAHYRILMISAHGEVNIKGKDGKERTGVILSDGIMLTAAEIGQLEVVPELVFLNCCHLGKTTPRHSAYNRLAYSISRELIEMGVRCVIAAGWAVNDQAACTFAEHFFHQFVAKNQAFGKAVWQARQVCFHQHREYNTWGAYQAYGDPSYTLEASRTPATLDIALSPVDPQELIRALEELRLAYLHTDNTSQTQLKSDINKVLAQAPTDWQQRSDVQTALAKLYQSIGEQGLKPAIQAYQKALAYDDSNSLVALEIIDKLATLEIKLAKTQQASDLIDKAIKRLQGLIDITTAINDDKTINLSRHLLMAQALKDKAEVELMKHITTPSETPPWQIIEPLLRRSLDYYAEAEHSKPPFHLEACINRLLLDALFAQTKPKADVAIQIQQNNALAKHCQTEARKQFALHYDFFDAIRAADAELSIYLNTGLLTKENSQQQLVKLYLETSNDLMPTETQIDSVVQHLGQLAAFIRVCPQHLSHTESPSTKTLNEHRTDQASIIQLAANELASQLRTNT